MNASWILVALPICAAVGCLSVAGLDADYRGAWPEGSGGSSSAGSGTGASSGGGETAGSGGVVANGGGGATGGTTTSHGGTGGAGGSGGTGPEDCQDGTDNNGDGLVDCADPLCDPDYECVPAAAGPWLGYYQLETAAYPAATIENCPGGGAPEVTFSGPGTSASCGACSCGAASGSCSPPPLGQWVNTSSCASLTYVLYQPVDDRCTLLATCPDACSNDQRVSIVGDSQLSNGGCAPSGGAATIPPLWQSEHHACELPAPGGGCGADAVCVPRGGGQCIRQDGAQPCPGGWTNPLTAASGADDTRGCSPCGCDGSDLGCSAGYVRVWDRNDCGAGGASPVDVSGTSCVSVQDLIDHASGSFRSYAGSLTGSCTPIDSVAVGSVTPTGEVTYCCR